MSEFPERYALVTLHRPANVDDGRILKRLLESMLDIHKDVDVVFPVHPRTRQRIAEFGIDVSRLRLLEPVPYIEFLALQSHATVVITDSGGIQEETTYLKIPCITVRDNTERPITITMGTNVLVGQDMGKLRVELSTILDRAARPSAIPPLWDGKSGERIAKLLLNSFGETESPMPELSTAPPLL